MQKLSIKRKKLYSESIKSLLNVGAIKKVKKCKGQFISSYFLRKKANGIYRLILNLQKLNKFITPPHFKLEDTRTVKNLISKNCYLSTLDLKDAYFLISITKSHRKYLRFQFQNKIYAFQCFPFGLSTAPFVFIKILKPVLTL